MLRVISIAGVLSCATAPALAQMSDALSRLLANFDRIDTNGDGAISRAEFRKISTARWVQIDRNGDGFLADDDFPSFASRRAKAQLTAIAHLDTNGDGRISQGEFLNGPEVVFTNADQNSDGVLVRAEIEARGS